MDLEGWVSWTPMDKPSGVQETVIPRPEPPEWSHCDGGEKSEARAPTTSTEMVATTSVMVPQPGPLIPTYPMGYQSDATKLPALKALQFE